MFVQPYLYFDGRCEEALDFYKQAAGAETTMLMRFGQSPGAARDASNANKIMHAAFRIGATMLLASDGNCGDRPLFKGVSLSLTVQSEAEADSIFAALAVGGKISMPMATTFFAKRFGQVIDRFGLEWMIMLPA